MKTALIISIIVIMMLAYFMMRFYYKSKKYQCLYSNENERNKILYLEVKTLKKSVGVYQNYNDLFRTYYNEDWNRDTPFKQKIEALQIFFKGSFRIYPLSTLCKNIPISKETLEHLKSVFQEDFNTILEMPLGRVFMFSADLKSYREGSSENGTQTPQEFYQWRLKFFT